MSYDKYESAADIVFSISTEDDGSAEVPVASIDTTKEVEIEEIRGNSLKAIGFSVTEIRFSGALTFDGNSTISVDGEDLDIDDIEEFFEDEDGVPKVGATLTILHENDDRQTTFYDVMIVTDGYETSTGEVSGTSYDWIARDRKKEEVDG